MNFEEMLGIAKHIMKLNPHYILCGSLGLIVRGTLAPRDIGDIDFVCLREDFDEEKLKLSSDGYGITENDGYTCYKTVHDTDGMFYDVFVFDDSKQVMASLVSELMVQESEQMLEFKKLYGRYKDTKDLNNIKE